MELDKVTQDVLDVIDSYGFKHPYSEKGRQTRY